MKKILITGANGQLMSCLKESISTLPLSDFKFIFKNSKELNITEEESVKSYFSENNFYAVINGAAYTSVDKAEIEIKKSYEVNAKAVKTLAIETAKQNAIFLHISTDYVFDGNSSIPYTENHTPNPQNIYGKSKLKGEEYALKNNPKSIIIRTAWVYSQYGKNFLKTMLELFENKNEINVINDQYGSPTNANDLARAILKIITLEKLSYGIFNYTNSGETTWFDFSNEIKKIVSSNIKITAIPSSSYPSLAKRPKYSVLNCEKISMTYHLEIPNWKDSLKKVLKKLNKIESL